MAEEVKYNNTLVSGRADETLSYTRYIKDESSGKSTKELLDEKVNKTDQLGTTQIADKAVTTEKLAEHSVDNSKLSPDSVSYEKIQNDAVITEKIQNKAVTTEKVEDKAITNSKLGDQSVDGRVVREASLETKHFANESVTTEKVARKSITKDKLADNSVDDSQVVDGSIGNAKLSPDSVTTEKIKDSSVTNEKVADDTLGIEKFDPELRKTIQAATGLPDDLSQMIQDVDKSVKQLHEKDTDLQSQIDDKQQQITSNDEDISLLQTRSTQMEKAIKSISASGGASLASAVTYDNTESGLDSVTAQGAIDELANKKFDKENIAQEFGESEDKVVSQFALPFREIESPEFLHCIVDAEDHFIFGVQLDGSIEWSKGIPAPIRAKLQDIINQCQQDKTDILEAINAAKEELSASIAALQEGKVDKEEGKSLIEDEVKECFRVIENKEFIKAVVDSDDKVLFGFYRATGKPYYPLNEMYHVEQNEEFFALWLDAANHLLLGIRRDGQIIGEIHAVNALKQVISQLQSDVASLQEKIDTNLQELLDVFSLQDNEEYLAVEQDAEGKVLSATNPDGSHYINNAKSETIPTEFEHIEDPEGRTEITTDAEDKVMSYRDSEGKKHEHDMEVTNLDVSNLNLQGNSVNNIQDALEANGFEVKSKMDWSDLAEIHIPEPQCAFVNLTGELPTSKGHVTNGVIDFYDMQGNYFKKYVEIDIHGRTSALFKKKNYTLDFFNDKEHSESFSIKFGDWVAMDSYYFQGWYSDAFRGIDIIAYKLYQQIVESRGYLKDKPYKYHIFKDIEEAGNDTHTDVDENLGKNALCTPMGFPVVLYLNGNFFGIYTVMLKKNRVNFLMNKKDYNAIMLDLDNGNIVNGIKDWSSFEIRNPKTLICMDGTKYDGDNPKELIDMTSEIYDASNKDMKNSAKTKDSISGLADAYNNVKEAVSTQKNSDEIKQLIEEHYNVDYVIDYIIFSNIIQNIDGWSGNWQWTTWDGIKWNPNPYDLNATFGLDPYGIIANPASRDIMKTSITNIVYDYYLDDIKKRYAQLRHDGIISLANIVGLFNSWCKRIGAENFNKEFEKWNTSPSQRSTNINTTYWKRVSGAILPYPRYSNTQAYSKDNIVAYEGKLYKSLKDGNVGNDVNDTAYWEEVSYNAEKNYNIGDTVLCSSTVSIKFQCIKACIGQSPVKLYNESLGILGFYDSIGRVYKWMEKKITLFDSVWEYNKY